MKTNFPLNTSIFIFIYCFCLIMGGCNKLEKKKNTEAIRQTKIFKVGSIKKIDWRTYPAKVRSNKRVKLAFQVSGRVVSFPVKAGEQVKKGQLLGELDKKNFKNALNLAIAKYKQSKSNFIRYSKLVKSRTVSVEQYEEKLATYEMAKAIVEIAKKELTDTHLLAPFNGVVAATFIDNFQNIHAKQEILSLQKDDNLELVIDIPEKDIITLPVSSPKLNKISKMIHAVAIFPTIKQETFPLKLKEFETEADSYTQTIRVTFAMQRPKNFCVMPGMTAMVRVSARGMNASKGYWIPSEAVAGNNKGQSYVWITSKDMTVHKQLISIGDINGKSVEVIKGLTKGNTIAVSGINFLSEGIKIKQLNYIGDRKINLEKQ